MPPKRGGISITLKFLQSLKDHLDFDVAHFPSTASPTTSFTLSSIDKSSSTRYFLNLGRVENIASVSLNSKDFGLSWLPPFEIDVTSAIRRGWNRLRVEVTNCWPNRLIEDEYLPEEATYNSIIQNYAVEASGRGR
jgi:hypothetical protein